MNVKLKRCLAVILALFLALGNAAAAVADDTLDAAIEDTAAYMYRTVQDPQVGSIGGEWAVLGLARSGYESRRRTTSAITPLWKITSRPAAASCTTRSTPSTPA